MLMSPYIIVRANHSMPVMFFDERCSLEMIATEAEYVARRDQQRASIYDVKTGQPICMFYPNGDSNGDPRN